MSVGFKLSEVQLEKKLLKRLKKHDKKAQLLFYKMCFGVMMSTALRYNNNKDDAACLVNESFMKVLTNIDKYDEKIPLEAWLRKIVVNSAINEYKKFAKKREVFQDKSADYENSSNLVSYNDAIESYEKEEVKKILESLPKATLLVFNMFALDGYSHKEVSQECGITVETSKWHVKEARKKLKTIWINS